MRAGWGNKPVFAKPHMYPIADVNVLTVWSLHTGMKAKGTWETYEGYCNYFKQIAGAAGVAQAAPNVAQLKTIDNALVVFGRFLIAYCRPIQEKMRQARPHAISSHRSE